jgi:TolA-binding protein
MSRRLRPALAGLVLVPAVLSGVLAVPAARAESLEDSCRFAEALGDRLYLPDKGLQYLASLKAGGKVPPEQQALYDGTVVFLLELQVRQETDPARREEGLTRAQALVQPTLDRLTAKPDPKKPRVPFSAGDFRTVLAFLRITQAAAKGAADQGPRLKRLHALSQTVYKVLEASDFGSGTEEDLYQKLDLMVEFSMVDGGSVLMMKGAAGLTPVERLKAFQEGVEDFKFARSAHDDESNPDAFVGFPAAYLGLAQCHLAIAAEASDDKPRADQAREEAKRVLGEVLKNPANPALSPVQAGAARYEAAKQLLELAFSVGDLPGAKGVVQAFRQKAGKRQEPQAQGDLLEARVDMEGSRQSKVPAAAAQLKDKAMDTARRVQSSGGASAPEAEALLSAWEGLSGRSRRNWKAEAEEALTHKSYEEAERKFRALIRTAGRNDALAAQGWYGLGECLRQRQRHFEALFAFERAARLLSAGERAGVAAALAVSCLQEATKDLPSSASVAQWKASLKLLADFPQHKNAPAASYKLGGILFDEKDYESAIGYFRMLKPGDLFYEESVYLLGRCLVQQVRDLQRQGQPADARIDQAGTALALFESVAAKAPREKNLGPRAAEAGFLRIEIQALARPERALELIEAYPRSYPDAGIERRAELVPIKALALAAKGDWAAAQQQFEAADKTTAGKKPWPLLRQAQVLQKLAAGKPQAGAFAALLANKIALNRPFNFKDAYDRFVDNFSNKRYADAIVAGEQILENEVPNREDAVKARAYVEENLPECYCETKEYSKAAPLLAKVQEDVIILGGYNRKGPDGLPPPLKAKDRALWERTALACTRTAEQMPPGDARKAMAERASDSWVRFMDGMIPDDPAYWSVVLDALRADVLAGKYSAARDRVHGLWISYPELGGQKDRFVESLKGLAQAEAPFSEDAKGLLQELQGE